MKGKGDKFSLAAARMCSVLIAAVLLSGCAIDGVLFTTKSQVGLDIGAEPPAMDLGYGRDELVIEPVLEGGKTLPVLASLNYNNGNSEIKTNTAFATGKAAVILASDRIINGLSKITDDESLEKAIKGSRSKNGEKKHLFFGTRTKLGLNLSWSPASQTPSVHFGWKRQELAISPLIDEKIDSEKTETSLVSLISIMNFGANFGQLAPPAALVAPEAPAGPVAAAAPQLAAGANIYQFFATGFAATLLANQDKARNAFRPKLVPGVAQRAQADLKLFSEMSKARKAVMTSYDAAAKAKKTEIYNAAVALEIITKPAASPVGAKERSALNLGTLKYITVKTKERLQNMTVLKDAIK